MEPNVAILIGFLVLMVSLMSGLPIFLALTLTGFVGIGLLEGFGMLNNLGYLIWGAIFKWTLLAIPGFVFMGAMLFHHGFGRQLYDTCYKWLGRFPGGLLISSTAMSALFGFISGSAMAGVATIGSIAIPEVEKRGYDRKLSLGAFTIGGTLAALIPPSVMMILYAVLAEVSLGKLFFASILPGLLLSGLIILYIFLRVLFNPALAPPSPSFSWAERFHSLIGLLPVIIVFLVVLGGIYIGVWSAIEAASAGALFSVVLCLAYRRLNWNGVKESLYMTVRVCVMVYMILIGAAFLNHFIYIAGINDMLSNFINSLDISKTLVMVCILLIMTALGCVLDVIALMMLSIPVFAPLMADLGFDLVWFGIIVISSVELALITPPVGVNLYIIKDLAPPDTKMSDIIWGVLPYILVVWVFFALLLFFPEIVYWLPSTMKH